MKQCTELRQLHETVWDVVCSIPDDFTKTYNDYDDDHSD